MHGVIGSYGFGSIGGFSLSAMGGARSPHPAVPFQWLRPRHACEYLDISCIWMFMPQLMLFLRIMLIFDGSFLCGVYRICWLALCWCFQTQRKLRMDTKPPSCPADPWEALCRYHIYYHDALIYSSKMYLDMMFSGCNNKCSSLH